MWRTLIINTAERVKLRDNWLIVETEQGEERIPVEELYSVVIDNPATMLSVGAINALTENNVHILAKFRKFLIKDGFFMLQFSVYTKIARNHDDATRCIERVKRNLPKVGSVRVLSVTEKQYASMLLLVGEETKEEIFLKTKEILEL